MNGSNDMALVLSRISARYTDYDTHELVLKDISFSVPESGFVSIIGPSGAGKSTLMRVILGLMRESEGTIVRNFSRPAMVFQNYALFPWLTALENVAFGLKMRGVRRKAREKIARAKLEEVGLGHLEGHYPRRSRAASVSASGSRARSRSSPTSSSWTSPSQISTPSPPRP